MEKNLFIIHGFNGDTSDTFGPYVENEAKKRNLIVYLPIFPSQNLATYKGWSKEMDKYKKSINEKTIIIAHSLGANFIPRYLVENNLSIGLYISLAGFLTDHSGIEAIAKAVTDFKPNEQQIDQSIELMKERYSLYSDNDHLNPREELERYADRFKSKKIFIPNIGHMGRKSGVKEIPEIKEIMDNYLN